MSEKKSRKKKRPKKRAGGNSKKNDDRGLDKRVDTGQARLVSANLETGERSGPLTMPSWSASEWMSHGFGRMSGGPDKWTQVEALLVS